MGYQRHLQLLDELEFYEVTTSTRQGGGYGRGVRRFHKLNHDPEIVLGAVLAEEPHLQHIHGEVPENTIIPTDASLKAI